MGEKITGYGLLTGGLLIILFAAISAYFVFTNKAQPVKLFSVPGISLDTSMFLPKNLPPEAQALLAGQSQKIDFVSPELLNTSLNLYAHLFFMGFVATIGYKVASLGVMLIRPVVVKMKQNETVAYVLPTHTTPPPPTSAV